MAYMAYVTDVAYAAYNMHVWSAMLTLAILNCQSCLKDGKMCGTSNELPIMTMELCAASRILVHVLSCTQGRAG